MDNQTRSETTRKKAIEAAFTILAREGVGGLTFDSLSRESGVSKGGLLHQFRTKHGVLTALLDYQRQQFEQIRLDYLAKDAGKKAEPNLAAHIAVYRESIKQPHSVARAVLAALVESPELLDDSKAADADRMKALQRESGDLELSLLRYFAASGIAFNSLLGLAPLPQTMINRLFDRLLDEDSWQTQKQQPKTPKRAAR
ncbi:TetR/AcrR family transcriptional regulator [Paraburkholderia hospita]|jgi:AcrR family transcriptional regulator|uniref:TetR family transcriptional regulator n=1 Tax=Paraburkholderia hospita TaxID=169430 RepID=A0AAN1JIM5_9BURK|nr:TetR/AcrR family transcriptional regulator [Paraburkholderia hospita]SKD02922.1 transcriptional regulator, TetR family [Burkholderia sp. CF099]AUT74774.1 TetR/AcrR family transcriptional regulator [Paraburkholderia hospita]EIN02709.1 TetR family transcriptional regulator [Paraburkholderia hospita]OUL75900.1 TetR family transcriptional regulator [Paraburkholderia hospita]OUL83800.1 TetR family transcriptional regulator [Paraburkholderia hospita]